MIDTMDIDTYSFDNYFAGDDTELEFNADDFTFEEIEDPDNKIIKPKFNKNPIKVKYDNAVSLIEKIKLYPGEQVHGIVKGDFVFGDFIEALLFRKNVECKNMYISTLSLSQNNIDSFVNSFLDKRIGNLTLMLSNYFYSHEKEGLIKYLHDELTPYGYDLIIRRNHTKICLMEISNIKLVLTGSANLRSSNSLEQFVLQESKGLYEFYKSWFEDNNNYTVVKNGSIL